MKRIAAIYRIDNGWILKYTSVSYMLETSASRHFDNWDDLVAFLTRIK